METELLVAEVDERRPVRQPSRPIVSDDVAKTDAYRALIALLEQLPQGGEVSSPPVQGSSQFLVACWCCGRALDLRLTGRGFRSQLVRFHVT